MKLNACDNEPIHIPGSIQPHGLLLIVSAESGEIVGGAGEIENRLRSDWLGLPVGLLIGEAAAERLNSCTRRQCELGRLSHAAMEGVAFRSGAHWLVQLEPAAEEMPESDVLGWMHEVGLQFERSADLKELCDRAAHSFAELTGYDRVMIYRFVDEEAGEVIAEARSAAAASFLNHRFPASDIPRQARALYVRNRVRVIPDVNYTPQPVRPAAHANFDMSDIDLRSVSPVHIEYLQNMGVQASASMSIVRDGVLWGLVACHHSEPRLLDMTKRRAAVLVAAGLARQIAAKEEAQSYRERLQIRTEEDAVYGQLAESGDLFEMLKGASASICRLFSADGFAVVHGGKVYAEGSSPEAHGILALADWVQGQGPRPYVTDTLSGAYEPALAYCAAASGLLSVTVSSKVPTVLMWFRAEEVEVQTWAGNPHEARALKAGERLTPRASFEDWTETVRGKARAWKAAEVEGARRFLAKLYEIRQNARIRDLSESLHVAVADKDRLIAQKDTLLREVNHRVQNSIQLIMAFLNMQSRATENGAARESLEEAQRRLAAVALVHRRLYADDNVELVDLSRYLAELIDDLKSSIGNQWSDYLSVDLAPVMIPADNAVHVGLVLVELVINAQKYAYGGDPGPISVRLEEHRSRFRLIVSDRGVGRRSERVGFGSRVMKAMVSQLSGTLEDDDYFDGLRVVLTAPLKVTGATSDRAQN